MTVVSFRNDAAVTGSAGGWLHNGVMQRLLLVDDDAALLVDVQRGLEPRGYRVRTAGNAAQAREDLERQGPFDLVLLDVTLPDESGWSILEGLREAGDATPVIFLTGSHTAADRVRGLRLGADDYVIKPFDFEELVARIEAVLRRQLPPEVYGVGDLRVELSSGRVLRDGAPIELSQREFQVLRALILAGGEVRSRPQLLAEVWDMHSDPGTNVVDVVVMRLRRKLDAGSTHSIETVVGEGYRVRAERLTGATNPE